MGCQNTKTVEHKKQKYKVNTGQDDPPINIQANQIDLISPRKQLTQKACGYEFQSTKSHSTGDISCKTSRYKELQQSVQKQYEKCVHFYKQHNIDVSKQHADKLNKLLISLANQEAQTNKHTLQKCLSGSKLQQMKQLMKLIFQEYNDVINFEQQIYKGGWVEKSDKKGVKVSTRREGQTVGALVESQIQTPFQILISILIEMNLYKQFIPFVRVSSQQKQVARNCRIGYSQNHIPFFSVRQSFFQGIGYNRLEKDGTLFLYTRSIHNREDLKQRLGYNCNVNQKFVQLEYKYFVLKYQPITNCKGNVTIAMNVNAKMDFLPMWILDKVSEDFGQDFLKNILKVAKQFKGSKWEENVQKNPYLFNFFKKSIDQYFEAKQHRSKKQHSNQIKNN